MIFEHELASDISNRGNVYCRLQVTLWEHQEKHQLKWPLLLVDSVDLTKTLSIVDLNLQVCTILIPRS